MSCKMTGYLWFGEGIETPRHQRYSMVTTFLALLFAGEYLSLSAIFLCRSTPGASNFMLFNGFDDGMDVSKITLSNIGLLKAKTRTLLTAFFCFLMRIRNLSVFKCFVDKRSNVLLCIALTRMRHPSNMYLIR